MSQRAHLEKCWRDIFTNWSRFLVKTSGRFRGKSHAIHWSSFCLLFRMPCFFHSGSPEKKNPCFSGSFLCFPEGPMIKKKFNLARNFQSRRLDFPPKNRQRWGARSKISFSSKFSISFKISIFLIFGPSRFFLPKKQFKFVRTDFVLQINHPFRVATFSAAQVEAL